MLAYAEYIQPIGHHGPFPQRIKTLHLETGQETLLVEPRFGVSRLKLLTDRAIWMEQRDSYSREAVVEHDFASGTTTDLTIIDRSGWAFPYTRIDDIGQAGVLISRGYMDEASPDTVIETIELLTYDGQTRTLDLSPPPSDFPTIPRCIGPYVVYPKGDRWIIWNPADDTRQDLDPFLRFSATRPAS
jgi:hypothetical protein